MHALPADAPDAADDTAHTRVALVPICIRVMDLRQRLRMPEYADVFSKSWNCAYPHAPWDSTLTPRPNT